MKLFSTSCETLYLGWDGPLLPRAASFLRERYSSDTAWSLRGLDCVLPSSHSARRLSWLLRREAERHKLELEAPRIMTIGQLAENLYQPERPVALEFEQSLAWARVLQAIEATDLSPLLPVAPPRDSIGPWLEFAGTLRRMHEELAASRVTFCDVLEYAETASERRRWELLNRLQQAYLVELAEAGLADPYTARSTAVMNRGCHSDRTIILVGTSDLSDALVEMLRSLDSPILAMVSAPERAANQFNEFGCVETESWIKHKLPLRDENLLPAGDMLDQSEAVAQVVAEFAKSYSADQVSVGVTDESQVGPIELQLRGCGVATHRHLGWTISETAIGRLLDLTSTFLQRHNWQSLAALVRHADVCRFINQRIGDEGKWIQQLDGLLAEHFPSRISDPLPPKAEQRYPVAIQVGEEITQWLAPFRESRRPIAKWSETIQSWLRDVYGDRLSIPDHADRLDIGDDQTRDEGSSDEPRSRTDLALEATARLLKRFADLNERLDVEVDGDAALEMLAARLSDIRVLARPSPADVEILGWLDLALDDAPALVVDGLNHPFVPRAVTSDPFLPGSLRAKLPVADNDRRYARDVYAMQVVLSSRPETRFVVGSRGPDKSPTPPSRLLAAADAEDIARRVRTLLSSQRHSIPTKHHWDVGPDVAQLPVPNLNAKPKQVDTLSVTAFRDYLICPYRFYLRHVLRLRPLDDVAGELAANQFGDLVHGALELFGNSDNRDAEDAGEIEQHLTTYLQQHASEHYSEHASSAVQIQIAQAERRLRAVAQAQALRRADGWRIDRVEASVGPNEGACIEVGGDKVHIKGRFDRIDVRDKDDGTQEWAILDYKTHGHPPDKKHLRKLDDGYEWIDLQLPLYRMMVPFLGIDAEPKEVELGYFNIGEKDGETKINKADFGDELMDQAEVLIKDIVRKIREGIFPVTTDRVQYDDYEMILQTGIASRLLNQADLSVGQEVSE